MPDRVTLTRIASARPFGQQRYELSLVQALKEQSTIEVTERVFTSLRSGLPAAVRIPFGLVNRLPNLPARLLGAAFGGWGLVHRLDLRLPPAPWEVVTVHDMAPFRFSDEGSVPRFTRASVTRCKGAICVSTFAAEEARDVLGIERTWVAPNGVDDIFRQAQPAAPEKVRTLCAGLIARRFVVHTGGASLRKNLGALAAAWRIVVKDVDDVALLLVGPPDARKQALFAGVPRTHFVTSVTTSDLAALVAAAEAVVVPSLYEGFGLPAAEAMAAGTPVIAAATSSLPEVVGNAGLLVEPAPEELAAGLVEVLTNAKLAVRLRAAGLARSERFTWERSAAIHAAVYTELLVG